MSRLQALYSDHGQSPWLDNLRRGWITSGELARWVVRGVRGITSNPTIFQKAIEASDEYDGQFRQLVAADKPIEHAYWDMVVSDIEDALQILRPVHDASDGVDGYVSVEVAPALARDAEGTIAAARDLHSRIDEPNLFVKVPATAEGVVAIRQLISEGHSINVTLIFGLDRYEEVIEAYLSGLEAYDGDLSRVASVASFFVSRVDTEIDRQLDAIGSVEALALRGKTAVAQAQAALQRSPLGGARGPGCPGPAPAVGVDVHEEPHLRRHPLRRHADRAGHGEHHAGEHPRGLRGPRHAGPHRRRRLRGGGRGAGGGRAGGHRPGRREHPAGGPGRGHVRQELRRARGRVVGQSRGPAQECRLRRR
jgi:transaldolase